MPEAKDKNAVRGYSQMADDLISNMLSSSPFNSVDWVRFNDVQIDDFIRYSNEYSGVSGGNVYLYRSEKYTMKASIKRWLRIKGVKFNGHEYKIAKHLLTQPSEKNK